ncbi:hypothetical protein GLYMA_09G176750v4 [Glycine max]|nr:hypothetical protein GLYMA_09G176750v4 [Glycine max]KAH1043505.1 hypothetical protein GYH30_025378 [Glycine max]
MHLSMMSSGLLLLINLACFMFELMQCIQSLPIRATSFADIKLKKLCQSLEGKIASTRWVSVCSHKG